MSKLPPIHITIFFKSWSRAVVHYLIPTGTLKHAFWRWCAKHKRAYWALYMDSKRGVWITSEKLSSGLPWADALVNAHFRQTSPEERRRLLEEVEARTSEQTNLIWEAFYVDLKGLCDDEEWDNPKTYTSPQTKAPESAS